MNEFLLQLTRNNASFEGDNLDYETARILREVADLIESGHYPTAIRDINGNKVGYTLVKEYE